MEEIKHETNEERENRLDSELNIRTANDLDEIKVMSDHTYEGTGYVTLDIIIDMLELGEDDVLVDLGCGLGKVIYYVNHKVGCKTIGVEGDERIFKLLSENHDGYKNKSSRAKQGAGNVLVLGSTGAPVKIVNSKVEDIINISEELLDNHSFANAGSLYFYFFNPFPVDILKGFISRVIEEAGDHHFGSKKISFVFYYLSPEYQMALREFPLKLEQITRMNDYYKDEFEKCCIYSLTK
ncbi:Histone methylation protein DOT1 [Eubacterium ruminantium]|nr:Histone methylation protein DOT1 [Eubacterium ruminantium]